MTTTLKTDVFNYLKAGFPALYIVTWEEHRAEQEIKSAVGEMPTPRGMWHWSITKGWVCDTERKTSAAEDPEVAIKAIESLPEDSVYVLRDFHFYMENPVILRRIRDLLPVLKSTGRTLIILSPRQFIPIELEKDLTLLTFDLPTREDLNKVLSGIIESVGDKKAAVKNRAPLLDSSRGQTMSEAENTFALALVKHGNLGDDALKTVQREKANIIKKTGILEFYEPNVSILDIGGLNDLKEYTRKRQRAFSDEAKTYGLPVPRGLLLVGVQGCGKSLAAKAIAASWNLPLLRFDVGRVFASLVGQSEENIRKALAIAEACAPVVLWLDEIEKGLSGLQSSGQTDSGVSARVFGTFLTWMNEKTAPVYVVATSNDISAMPAELSRKGRFDEIFFVDLPTQTERAEIFEIHLKKRQREPKKFDVGKLALQADQFSGAEIEEAIVSGMFNAFDESAEVTTSHILAAIDETKPLAVTMKEKVEFVRGWAKDRARPATTVISQPIGKRRVQA